MTDPINELTVKFVEDGFETVKEIDKEILSKGAWCTIIYRYQNWDRKSDDYGPDRYSIRRYQKRNGEYKLKSKFNISSDEQAHKIINALNNWMGESKS